MDWLKARLVDDWHALLKLASVRLHIVAAAIALLYEAMPALDPQIAAMLPAPLQAKAIGTYALIGLVARVIKFRAANAQGR